MCVILWFWRKQRQRYDYVSPVVNKLRVYSERIPFTLLFSSLSFNLKVCKNRWWSCFVAQTSSKWALNVIPCPKNVLYGKRKLEKKLSIYDYNDCKRKLKGDFQFPNITIAAVDNSKWLRYCVLNILKYPLPCFHGHITSGTFLSSVFYSQQEDANFQSCSTMQEKRKEIVILPAYAVMH